jgi:hypothetical protein
MIAGTAVRGNGYESCDVAERFVVRTDVRAAVQQTPGIALVTYTNFGFFSRRTVSNLSAVRGAHPSK